MAGLLQELRKPSAEVEMAIAAIVLAGLVGATVVIADVAVQLRTDCDRVLSDLGHIPGL